jgi:hypothetical protein
MTEISATLTDLAEAPRRPRIGTTKPNEHRRREHASESDAWQRAIA